ncbi:hypothetical protein GCM10025869_18320 [Homoserinibacter gongjuensis]|uniref:Uncharacterized protein n=1 Tax=Homoserinibacter gongjuensis TaxID=1162968 RepID=A0ABQ6JSL5_9MICO|nr:hypothetical protein GCM10025869_18320 [Homoserinibacter gongjuensis]
MQARGHEPREVRHVDPELGAHLVGDRPERREVELARVGRPAGDDHLRLHLEGGAAHLIHVDAERLGVDLVGVGLVELAGEVELHTVREVPAVRELEAQDAVAGLRDGRQHGGVGGGTGMRLHVGVGGAEELLGTLDGEGLDHVDELASAVVTATGVALGVLVGEHRALSLEHGPRHEVLGGDHLERRALATEFGLQRGGDLGVDLSQRGKEGGFDGHWRSLGSRENYPVIAGQPRRTAAVLVFVAPRW